MCWMRLEILYDILYEILYDILGRWPVDTGPRYSRHSQEPAHAGQSDDA